MSTLFAKLQTIIYLHVTNQIMIPESGVMEWRHQKNVHRLPPFHSHLQTQFDTGYM